MCWCLARCEVAVRAAPCSEAATLTLLNRLQYNSHRHIIVIIPIIINYFHVIYWGIHRVHLLRVIFLKLFSYACFVFNLRGRFETWTLHDLASRLSHSKKSKNPCLSLYFFFRLICCPDVFCLLCFSPVLSTVPLLLGPRPAHRKPKPRRNCHSEEWHDKWRRGGKGTRWCSVCFFPDRTWAASAEGKAARKQYEPLKITEGWQKRMNKELKHTETYYGHVWLLQDETLFEEGSHVLLRSRHISLLTKDLQDKAHDLARPRKISSTRIEALKNLETGLQQLTWSISTNAVPSQKSHNHAGEVWLIWHYDMVKWIQMAWY